MNVFLLFTTVCLAVGGYVSLSFIRKYWWRPRRLRRALERQGLKGPPSPPIVGNLLEIAALRRKAVDDDMPSLTHDTLARLLPHVSQWSKIYGRTFIYMWGDEVRIMTMDPDLVRDILCTTTGNIWGRSFWIKLGLESILGKGLVVADGDDWAQQRQIVGPAFHIENLKGLFKSMERSILNVVESLEALVQEGPKEVEISEYLSKLTADIIARTQFGSSYQKGKKVFEQLMAKAKLTEALIRYAWIPGSRYIPRAVHIHIWKLQRQVSYSLKEIIEARRDSIHHGSYGHDLLGLMLAEIDGVSGKQFKFTTHQLMDECKTFFMAGHETTAILLTWTMMLLARHPVWQVRARNEVMDICRGDTPTADSLSKLKLIGMILNESLRLYSPVPLISRQALRDIQAGNLFIPKGVVVTIPIAAVQHDREIWGEDVNEFKPERFAVGAAKAGQHPMSFMPFSFGPRNCVGQNFAMMEAKLFLAMMLPRFKLSLSSNYRHAPVNFITLKPRHGMQIILETLDTVHN